MLRPKALQNEKGMAILEIIPISIICVLLLSFSFGFFGVIHTGILNSIAARNYAFETFNHRTDLSYFRSNMKDFNSTELKLRYYVPWNFRTHSIASENRPANTDDLWATARNISFGWSFGQPDLIADKSSQQHESVHQIKDDGTRYEGDGVNPVWIQATYGICLSSKCSPD